MITEKKKVYEAPKLEIFEYVVEQGFAISKVKVEEEFSELTDNEGEYESGYWDNL